MKFRENRSIVPCGRIGQADMAKLTAAFRRSTDAHNNDANLCVSVKQMTDCRLGDFVSRT